MALENHVGGPVQPDVVLSSLDVSFLVAATTAVPVWASRSSRHGGGGASASTPASRWRPRSSHPSTQRLASPDGSAPSATQ